MVTVVSNRIREEGDGEEMTRAKNQYALDSVRLPLFLIV